MENKRTKRDICFIRVLVDGYAGQIRDITVKGLKAAIMEKAGFQVGEVKNFLLLPDDSLKLSPVSVMGKIKWVKKDRLFEIYGVELEGFSNNMSQLKELVAKWSEA